MAVKALTVAVVDDDVSFRDAIAGLIRSYGFHVEAFDSATGFLKANGASRADCLVLDMSMPDMTGLALQKRLAKEERRLPIIYMSAHADPQMRAAALNDGALAVLEKPCDQDDLLKYINLSLGIIT